MANYNIKVEVSLVTSFDLEIPKDVISKGKDLTETYIRKSIAEFSQETSFVKMPDYVQNFKEVSGSVKEVKSFTRIMSEEDSLENDLMEYDIF